MIEGGPTGLSGCFLQIQKDERVRKFHDVNAADLDGHSAQGVHPELLVLRDTRPRSSDGGQSESALQGG